MPDPHQIVDDIRAFLSSNDQTQTPALAELAASYAAACRETNERLRRCADLLKQGLRTEAVAMAEHEPNLLELVGALDLPEIADWDEICSGYELPRSPRLLLETAAALNEAYAAEQPLQAVLYTHRLLGLGRAPVRDRLQTLRLLAQQDADNPVWQEDIPAFEAERVKELKQEAAAAVRSTDEAAVDRLWAEIANSEWRMPVPQDLQDFLADAAAQYQRQRTVARLKDLLPKLNAAYGAMSYDECVSLLAQWSPLAASAGGDLPADMTEQAQSVADWVATEDARRRRQAEFAAACETLRDGLDRRLPEPALAELHAAAAAMGQSFPAELQEGYDARLLEFAVSRKRRKVRNRSFAAAGVIVIIAFAVFVTLRKIEGNKIDRYRAALQALIDQERMSEAEAVLRQYEGEGLAEHYKAEKENIQRSLAIEQARLEEFQVQMKKAVANGSEQLSEEAIKSAERVARTAQEKLQVAELRSKLDQDSRQRQEKYDADYSSRVAALAEEVAAVSSVAWAGADIEELGRKRQQWESRYTELDKDARASALVKVQLPLPKIIESLRKLDEGIRTESQRRTTLAEERRLLDAVGAASASASGLATALKGYVEKFPNTDRAKQMQLALAQEDAWRAMEVWASVSPAKPLPASLEELRARTDEMEKYAKEHPCSPVAKAVADYTTYLKQADVALKAGGSWDTHLGSVLRTSKLIQGVYVVKSGERNYYTRSDMPGKRVTIGNTVKELMYEVLLTRDVTETKTERLPAACTAKEPTRSTQWVLADEVLKLLGRRDGRLATGDWDVFGFDIIRMIRDQADVDPVLRALILQGALQATAETAPGVEQMLKQAIDRLATLRAEDVNFVNPMLAGPERAQAQEMLTALVALDQGKTRVVSRRQEILRGVSLKVRGLGVLVREAATWKVSTATQAADGLEVLMAFRDAPTGPYSLRRIAKAAGGRWHVDESTMSLALEGQMVFICAGAR